jgi:hypothetical protein
MSDKVDYLDEDPVISTQKFCVISVLTPKNFKLDPEKENKEKYFEEITEELDENDPNYNLLKENTILKAENSKLKWEKKQKDDEKKITMYTFKVRGSFDCVEDAQKRIEFLNSIDPNVNIYLAEVGKWCPFDDDPSKAKDEVYKDEELNRLMKGYKENQEKGKQFFEQRKAEMVSKAMTQTKEKKEDNKLKEQVERINALKEISEKIDTQKVKVEDNLLVKENELKEKEEIVKKGKVEIESKKSEIHSKEDKIRKLNDDLALAKKKYEEAIKRGKQGDKKAL